MFQSLIGIIEDFDDIVDSRYIANSTFQSLIGIIEDFDLLLYHVLYAYQCFNP